MIAYDDLLTWMTFRGRGKRNDLPREMLDGAEPGLVLWRLAALSHIDTVPGGGWQAAPPIIVEAGTNGTAVNAILCGGRTPGLLRHVSSHAAKSGVSVKAEAIPDQPALISLEAPAKEVLRGLAASANIFFQQDAAYTLMAALPAIASWPRNPIPAPRGRLGPLRRFSPSRQKWVESSSEQLTAYSHGLFHLRTGWRSATVLKKEPNDYAEIDRAAGQLAVVRGKKLASLSDGRLSLPSSLTPPIPILRALLLQTGCIPARTRGSVSIEFTGLAERHARLALALMGVRLK